MIRSQPKMVMTPEEYLVAERCSEIKNEYLDGEIFAMAGASRKHNVILTNVVRILGNSLVDRPCNIYSSDMKVKIEKLMKYSYVRKRRLAVNLHKLRLARLFYSENPDVGSFFSIPAKFVQHSVVIPVMPFGPTYYRFLQSALPMFDIHPIRF